MGSGGQIFGLPSWLCQRVILVQLNNATFLHGRSLSSVGDAGCCLAASSPLSSMPDWLNSFQQHVKYMMCTLRGNPPKLPTDAVLIQVTNFDMAYRIIARLSSFR